MLQIEATINQDIKCFDSGNDDLNRWLALTLKAYDRDILAENREGTTVQSVKSDTLLNFRLPIPPLSEQRRIVAKLELVLARVDACRARLETVPTLLKRFRQSVLAAACSGRLTEDWREEITPWETVPLADIITELRNGISTKPNQSLPGTPILRISSVRPGKVDTHDIRYLPDAETLMEKYALREGDLLFTRYNGTKDLVGVCGVVKSLGNNTLLYPDKLMRVRVQPERVLPEYLEIYFSDATTRDIVMAASKSSAGQIGISGESLKNTPVSLPLLAEQHEIVRRVTAFFAFADQVEARYTQAKTHTDRLTQSILAKAFRGELVPQDPADEPAAELLARKREKKTTLPSTGQ